MIHTRAIAAALLLAAAAALAQTTDVDTAVPEPVEKEQKAGAGKNAKAPEGATSKPAGTEKSPSDYRASEKISEDLPVSFPVDI